MITQMTLRNFKSVGEQTYRFTPFDLLVGRNNSGKSTVLQALVIWQFCIDEFHRSGKSGSRGIQIVLPNFTAVPVPEFNLLWKDRTDRHWPVVEGGRKKQEYILIVIDVEWRQPSGEAASFGIELRYHSSQTIYAIPRGGWENFRTLEQNGHLPRIAYVPPFSGLEPTEKWLDEAPIRQQVGKGQPGSILRNLLLRVCPPRAGENGRAAGRRPVPAAWKELAETVRRWFSVEIHEPGYDSGKDVYITVEYRQNGRDFDIIAGGSGFHQTLTLLAFLYGYKPTTILLDEPDAHLHVNLQREILDYFKRRGLEASTQFLIATHAEEFVRGVDAAQLISLLNQMPRRVLSAPEVLRAMAEVSNEDIARIMASPFILYVEGESDERILRAWAGPCGAEAAMDKFCFKVMGGGDKQTMKARADEHFAALRQLVPEARRLMLLRYDDRATFHPEPDNPAVVEWKRRNIENYLLVPDAWKRAAQQFSVGELFVQPALQTIDEFFAEQNLTLPPGRTWRNVNANVFTAVDGKRILFADDHSLFQQLANGAVSVKLIREQVAGAMLSEEVHQDVHE